MLETITTIISYFFFGVSLLFLYFAIKLPKDIFGEYLAVASILSLFMGIFLVPLTIVEAVIMMEKPIAVIGFFIGLMFVSICLAILKEAARDIYNYYRYIKKKAS